MAYAFQRNRMRYLASGVTLLLAALVVPTKPAQAQLTPSQAAQFNAGIAAFNAGNNDGAAASWTPLCQQQFAKACENMSAALYNLFLSRREDCEASKDIDFCLSIWRPLAPRLQSGCSIALDGPNRSLLCKAASDASYLPQAFEMRKLVNPPSPEGCIFINNGASDYENRCENTRQVFSHACAVTSRRTSCKGYGLGWGTGVWLEPEKGETAVYWYECYGQNSGNSLEEDPATTVFFSTTGGWKNAYCVDWKGQRSSVQPVFKSYKKGGRTMVDGVPDSSLALASPQQPSAPASIPRAPAMDKAAFDGRVAAAPNAGALYAIADEMIEAGDNANARIALRALLQRYPESPLVEKAADLLATMQSGSE